MAERDDFRARRLFVDASLAAGVPVPVDRAQANYLLNVLRLAAGDFILVFNGSDGEWHATIRPEGRKACQLVPNRQSRPQPGPPDLWYLFAPLKQARLDYMIQKAVEMGTGRLIPVLTDFTQVRRINPARMQANAIEAAEQCGILAIPTIDAPKPLDHVLAHWPADRRIVFADEDAATADPLSPLKDIEPAPLAVLVGPEGGFSPNERIDLRSRPFVTPISLGPRILRADTAAVAALAVVQAVCGDWRQ